MSTIDYKEILTKYINHVGCCEGITFIDSDIFGPPFTPEEVVVLMNINEGTPMASGEVTVSCVREYPVTIEMRAGDIGISVEYDPYFTRNINVVTVDKKPRAREATYKRLYLYLLPSVLNQLPPHIVESITESA